MQGTGGDARDARDGTGCRELEALGGGGGGAMGHLFASQPNRAKKIGKPELLKTLV